MLTVTPPGVAQFSAETTHSLYLASQAAVVSATDGSWPGGVEYRVRPGSRPWAQVLPPSRLNAQPMSSVQVGTLPTINDDNTLCPTAMVSGSASVACSCPALVIGSELTRTSAGPVTGRCQRSPAPARRPPRSPLP